MTTPTGPSSTTPALLARGVGVTLQGSTILTDLTFSVALGEFVALLGANGSGKSTLVRSAVGALPLTTGTLQIFGADVTDRRAVPWGRLGYVPQRSTAVAGVPATVSEVVEAGLLTGNGLARPRRARESALEALELVGLAHCARHAVGTLSGGQQQRVLIARALARRPDLLVLDEPLAGVDTANQEAFAATMARLHGSGIAVLVVLHETGALAPLLSRAVVLRHGRVVHDGAPPLPAPGHDGAGHDHLHAHDGEHEAPSHTGLEPDLRLADPFPPHAHEHGHEHAHERSHDHGAEPTGGTDQLGDSCVREGR